MSRYTCFFVFITTFMTMIVVMFMGKMILSVHDQPGVIFYRTPLIQHTYHDYYGKYDQFKDMHVRWHSNTDNTHQLSFSYVCAEPIRPSSSSSSFDVYGYRDDYFCMHDFIASPARCKAKIQTSSLVVYFHANDAHLGSNHIVSHIHRLVVELNTTVVAIEYPGYGLHADSKPDQPAMIKQGLALVESLGTCLHETNHITLILHGHSMGAAVATATSHVLQTEYPMTMYDLQDKRRVFKHHLVLEGAWTSVQQWLDYLLPWHVTRWICPYRSSCLQNPWDTSNLLYLRQSNAYQRTILIVGEQDRITPPFMTEELYHMAIHRSDLHRQYDNITLAFDVRYPLQHHTLHHQREYQGVYVITIAKGEHSTTFENDHYIALLSQSLQAI